MKNRILGVLALAALLLAAPLAGAQTKLKWAHVYETSEPYHQQALWAADQIAKRTNGRYLVEVFPASTLGKETDINQAPSLGTVDAQENPLPTIDAEKFYEVQKYIILTGHITESLVTIVAGDTWW